MHECFHQFSMFGLPSLPLDGFQRSVRQSGLQVHGKEFLAHLDEAHFMLGQQPLLLGVPPCVLDVMALFS